MLTGLILVACGDSNSNIDLAQEIVDKAILKSGANKIENSHIAFKFRDKKYKAIRENGKFQLVREFVDSLDVIKDVLSNSKFERFVNGTKITVADSMVSRYSNSVNSVHYFSVLPFGLNDAAVLKSYLGKVDVNGVEYHKVRVAFKKEGGGDDYDDVFIYWFNSSNYQLEFLAYQYHVNGGGIRFREAYNRREVEGVTFVDYKNYKADAKKHSLENLDQLFESNALKLLSTIELKDVKVSL
ncbi:MAG: hypothetical protein BM564_07375 [Bacteroidetes bacterium MedPE-SWsnd-G2]|nr:MAG: hypothetical protein BM564_07375 [Bacteroidetes bacterium MedPE-SWsnd-G2]